MNNIKRLSEADFPAIFDLSQFAFQYKLSKADMVKKEKEATRHTIWGYMDGERIAAKLHLIPLSIFINNKSFKMGGVSSVATWPEYRRKGMVKQLLFHALTYMKETGQTISFLHPFSFTFYRQYGWEHTFNLKRYSIPVGKMAGSWQGKGYVRRSELDVSLLNSIYTDYAKQFTGTVIRDEKWWEQRTFKQVEQIAIAYNENNEPEGYIHYHVQDREMVVKELAYRTVNGWHLLLEFIANHDSMVETIKMTVPEKDPLSELVHEPDFNQQIEPYFMARIVDVQAFLKEYSFEKAVTENQSVILSVDDPFFPDNEGVYHLCQNGKGVSVTHVKAKDHDKTAVSCSIQQLTSMLLGYKRPLELYRLDLIGGAEAEISKLDEWIPQQQTYYTLPDFF